MNWGIVGAVLGLTGLAFGAGAWVKSTDDATESLAGRIEKLESDSNSALARLDELESMASIPNGAVVAFSSNETNPCPGDEWKLYEEAKGRFVLGAGHGDRSELTPRKLRDIGGAESYQISIEQMPKHTHRISTDRGTSIHDGLGGSTSADYGILQTFSDIPNEAGWTTVLPNTLESTGGKADGSTAEHENMPPFIALYLCIKQ